MQTTHAIAFVGEICIANGRLADVARAIHMRLVDFPNDMPLVFDATTSRPIEFDLRGSCDDVLARLPKPEIIPEQAPRRGPGRPKLGVVAREITLLPRHWDWLAEQRGGASVALRRLIDDARRLTGDKDRVRLAKESAYRFCVVMAGNRPHYEDAMRALFASDIDLFAELTAAWPNDIREHARELAAATVAAPARTSHAAG